MSDVLPVTVKQTFNISNVDLIDLEHETRLFLSYIGCLCGKWDKDADWIPVAPLGVLDGSHYEIEQELTSLDCGDDIYYCLAGHIKIYHGTNCDFETNTITPNFRAEINIWDFKN